MYRCMIVLLAFLVAVTKYLTKCNVRKTETVPHNRIQQLEGRSLRLVTLCLQSGNKEERKQSRL